MEDKWKDTLENFSVTLNELNEKQQYYILGVAEGMAFVKETQQDKPQAVAT